MIRARIQSFVWEFWMFGVKEARSCIFAGSFFVLLYLSTKIPLFGLPRYDFLFISAILLQVILYWTKIETWDEVKTIFLFNIIGLALELYKTNPAVLSWSYPEPAFFKIATVPLYSVFMYAAVGSYIAQAWRIFDLRLTNIDHYLWSILIAAAIYINFFTNHFMQDIRYLFIPIIFIFFWRTRVYFTVLPGKERWMPLNAAFLLIAFFIWIAENISTFFGAWQYPNQIHAWAVVSTTKITSWFLMVIISFIIVTYLKHYKEALLKK